MNPLVPADEESNPFLDADLGPEPELPAGAPQVGVREPHVPRLVAVALDPHLAAERARDELDQPVEPHPRTSADVDRLGDHARTPGGRIPARGAASKARAVPVTLVPLWDAGSPSEGRAPGRAERCTTTATPSSGSGSRPMSASTKRNPLPRRSVSRFRSFTARA